MVTSWTGEDIDIWVRIHQVGKRMARAETRSFSEHVGYEKGDWGAGMAFAHTPPQLASTGSSARANSSLLFPIPSPI